VVLLEKGDFAQATSANSLKTIHGGFRYLRHGDLKRLRESVRERRALMQIAPHLVDLLPVVVPLYGFGLRGKESMGLALRLNDLLSLDRNRGTHADKKIPAGRILNVRETSDILPGLRPEGLRGSALWYDGQVYNTERLTLSFIKSASQRHAQVANYAEVTGLLQAGNRVAGVAFRDVLSGATYEVRGKHVLNAAGPWVARVPGFNHLMRNAVSWAKAANIVTRQVTPHHAFGIEGRDPVDGRKRFFFVAPWRHCSIIGTTYELYEGDPATLRLDRETIFTMVAAINRIYPAAGLCADDVRFAHVGLVPITAERRDGSIQLATHYRIIDHEKQHGVEGLTSLVGVKFTTARDVAQKAIDQVCQKLGRPVAPSRSALEPLCGAVFDDVAGLTADIASRYPDLTARTINRLVRNYGSMSYEVLSLRETNGAMATPLATCPLLAAQVRYAVSDEMAQTLGDVVLRRTDIGTTGYPGRSVLETCAAVMGQILSWDQDRIEHELDEVEAIYAPYSKKQCR
jgi:glycerol-3-phosphate dehydrogenase